MCYVMIMIVSIDCSHMKKCYKMQRCSHDIDLIMSSSYLCVEIAWQFLVSSSHHNSLHNLSLTFALKCYNFLQSSLFHFFIMCIKLWSSFLVLICFCALFCFVIASFSQCSFSFYWYFCVVLKKNVFLCTKWIPHHSIFFDFHFYHVSNYQPIRPSSHPNFMVTLQDVYDMSREALNKVMASSLKVDLQGCNYCTHFILEFLNYNLCFQKDLNVHFKYVSMLQATTSLEEWKMKIYDFCELLVWFVNSTCWMEHIF